MNVDTARFSPDLTSRSAVPSRKRNSEMDDAASDSTELYSASGEDSEDGFEAVRSRKAKRRSLRTPSPSSTSTVQNMSRPRAPAILFMPVVSSDNLRHLNRQAVSAFLERLVPNEITDIRINTRKNILAVDVTHATAFDILRTVTDLNGIKVRSHITVDKDTAIGVIYDVDVAIPNEDLPILVKTATPDSTIIQVSRIGNSRCVKIVFKGDTIPSNVKVGHFRHPVKPFIPKPLQCHKCLRLGHVRGVCNHAAVCARCAGFHTTESCQATEFKCRNCKGSHEATSRTCPRIKKEWSILKEMVREGSTHREAAVSVKKRRSRRHRRRSPKNAKNPPQRQSSPAASSSRIEKQQSLRETRRNVLNDKEAQKSAYDVAWPALPNARPPAELERRTSPSSNVPLASDKLPEQDVQVVILLKSLIAAIRTLLGNAQTSTARCALQVLDALAPVLESLH